MRCELQVKNLVKEFHSQGRQVTAVDNVSLSFPPGSFITLLGPSGCGKTTILRMIAGLEMPTSGDIFLDGQRITDVPPNARETSMVFQSYALFPHLTVFENVAYGLRLKRIPAHAITRTVNEKLEMMGLGEMGDRQPNQLSGGQQQRVALARALVMSPKVLLFDEPLSNLDAKLRVQVREEIRRLQRELGVTTVYVTHDQEEAMAVSDLVVIMNKGKLEQAGTPEEIYHEPKSAFVADFIGGVNLLAGTMAGPDTVQVLDRPLPIRNPLGLAAGEQVKVAVRPERVMVGQGPWQAEVERSIFLGRVTEYRLQVGGVRLTASVPGQRQRLKEGETVLCGFAEDGLLALRP